ncbi:MAG: AMP-binding protein, partial [bacterium]|nr:AMP-binding protein [bacterium]
YVVYSDPSALPDVREYLSDNLPQYMVPSYFVRLDEIPSTVGGKVDRHALPAPELQAAAGRIAPSGPVEIQLSELWSEVLGIDRSIIGIDSNFFALGGHSLKATILVSKIHEALNVKVSLTDVFRIPTIRGLAQYIHAAARERYAAVEPVENREYYSLSSAQKRLNIIHQMDLGNTAYNMPQFIPFEETPPVDKLEAAFTKLINRHESLRTSFHMIHNQPVQKVHDHVEFEIEFFGRGTPLWSPLHGNHSDVNGNDSDANGNNPGTHGGVPLRSFVRPFDLSNAPLLRVGLVKGGEDEHLLMVDMHHIISDGVSMGVLETDFIALYRDKTLPPLRIHYKDFSQWQNSPSQQESIANQETYWLDEFKGELPVLQLPADYPRPVVQSFEGHKLGFRLTPGETRELRNIALETGSTLFMVLLSLTTILLSRLSGQEDIVIGTPIAGRRHPDLEKIIGMFVNTLAIRNYPVGRKTVKGFIEEVKERTLNAFEHQEYQFEDLVERLPIDRDTGRNPLFDVMFILNNMDSDPAADDLSAAVKADEPHPEFSIDDYRDRVAKFDLTITAVESSESLFVGFQYCTKRFKKETVQRFILSFKRIASFMVESPSVKLSDIEIISTEEKQQLLLDFNDTSRDYPKEKGIYQWFEDQVEKTPARIAVTGDVSVTYKELDRRSRHLARLLNQKGVGPGTIAAIMMERSLEMVVGIYGILKAGGAYLPIAPDYPEERIHYMLKDSGAKVIVTDGLMVDGLDGLKIKDPGDAGQSPNRQTNPAYIIYTSGSTGHPKGVVVEQSSLVNLVFDLQRR